MKKSLLSALLLLVLPLVCIHAGGAKESKAPSMPSVPSTSAETTADISGGHVLVAYFSRAGENYHVGFIEKGNTEIVAEMIGEKTGGTMFQIQTTTPYPATYQECTDVAKREQATNARPTLLEDIEIDQYDVIFLGYPIWWNDLPMAVYTFMENHDFSGKTIVPFCTHEGSGLAGTVRKVSATASGATVLEGLAVRGRTAQSSQDETREMIDTWLGTLGLRSTR